MNESLTLKRRLRPNLLLPAILLALHPKFIFWRRVPSDRWDWLALLISLLLSAFFLWGFYRAFTGDFSFLIALLLGWFAKDIHDNALPIFARVHIKGDEITLGRVWTEHKSLKDVAHYQTSREDQPLNAIRFALYKEDFSGCILLVLDEEDSESLGEFLQARSIVTTESYIERMSPEEMEAKVREVEASIDSKFPFCAR